MRELMLSEFEACAPEHDARVEADPEIDRFCSRSDWILPFHRAFLPQRELCLARGADGFASLALRRDRVGRAWLEALECMWCFACPVVGPDGPAVLCELLGELRRRHGPLPVVLSGIPAQGTLLATLAKGLGRHFRIDPADATARYDASLAGGRDGWLSRRSRGFRRKLDQARRRAREAGVGFERVVPSADDVAEVYERALAIEARSWKSGTGNGVDRGPMRAFYAEMLPRLARAGQARAVFSTLDGVDIGYLYGGVVGDGFRGLQVSFDDEQRALAPGNLLQDEMITWLCEDGVRRYDLGSTSRYKQRWAEEGLVTVTLVLHPN